MNHEIPRLIGRLEATVEDHGRRLSKLEERPHRASIPWMELLPYAYGMAILMAAIVLVLTGKLTIIEAIKSLG